MLLVKVGAFRHFTRHFEGGSFSDRVILPGSDRCRVKVTYFVGAKGQRFDNLSHPFDETVRIIKGLAEIGWSQGYAALAHQLVPGDTFHVPAGDTYSIEFVTDLEAVCFFSQAADGTMPDDE